MGLRQYRTYRYKRRIISDFFLLPKSSSKPFSLKKIQYVEIPTQKVKSNYMLYVKRSDATYFSKS